MRGAFEHFEGDGGRGILTSTIYIYIYICIHVCVKKVLMHIILHFLVNAKGTLRNESNNAK